MSDKPPISSGALSNRKPSGIGCIAWPFAIVFLGIGLTAGYFLAARPMLGMIRARSWTATPCKIVSSELNHQGEGGTKVAIAFTYPVAQKEFRSDQYCFTMLSSNTSTNWKQKVVADHPIGKQTTCFVNPNDPGEAVIERGWVPDMWWGLFPIPFAAIGFCALLVATGVIRESKSGGPKSLTSWRPKPLIDRARQHARNASIDGSGPVILSPETTPLATLVGIVIIATFWNGIVSIFVSQVVEQFQRRGFAGINWFEAIFLLPFVAVGIGLVLAVFYCVLLLTNPRPTLIVSPALISLGDDVTVGWSLRGRSSSINEFSISLKGVEKATYRRGTNTTTDTSTFAEIRLVETNQQFEMDSGTADVTIPADSMHSFDAPNNKVVWLLEVRGKIRWWPDVSASFPITVLPTSNNRPTEFA